MSQSVYEVIKNIAQISANAYDGALDADGNPIKIGGKGLKREEGNPNLDSRTVDGFKVKVMGDRLVITYQSDIKLRDVYANDFESEMEQCCADVASYLKKEYKKLTKNNLNLTEDGEVEALVQKTSKVRVFVVATKRYKVGNLSNAEVGSIEDDQERSGEYHNKYEDKFNDFLQSGGWGTRPKNSAQN
jgi:hypothetical protein